MDQNSFSQKVDLNTSNDQYTIAQRQKNISQNFETVSDMTHQMDNETNAYDITDFNEKTQNLFRQPKASSPNYQQSNKNSDETLFLGGLKPNIKKDDIYNYFIKFGEIVNISLSINQKTLCNKGYSFVMFKDSSVIPNILKRPHFLENRRIECKISYGGDYNKLERQQSAMCKIFVKKLKKNTNDAKLFNYFNQFGELKNAYVIFDPENGRSKGFGYIQFVDYTVVDSIINLTHFIDGKLVQVNRFELQIEVGKKHRNKKNTKKGVIDNDYLNTPAQLNVNYTQNLPVANSFCNNNFTNQIQNCPNNTKNTSHNYCEFSNGYANNNQYFYNPENPYYANYGDASMNDMYAINDHVIQDVYKTDSTNQLNNDYKEDQYKNVYNNQQFIQEQYNLDDNSKYPAQYYYNGKKDDPIPYENNQSHLIAARNHESGYSNDPLLSYENNYFNSSYLYDDPQGRKKKEDCQNDGTTRCINNYKYGFNDNYCTNDKINKNVNLLPDENPENNSMNQQNFRTYEYNTSNAENQYDNYLNRDFYEHLINSVCTDEGYESNKY